MIVTSMFEESLLSVFGLREEVRETPGLQSRVASAEKPLGVCRTFLEESVLKSLPAPVSLWLKLALRDKRVV